MVFPTLLTLVYFVWMSTASTRVQQMSFAVGKVIQFGFPIVWVLLVERRGLNLRRPNARETNEGAMWAR